MHFSFVGIPAPRFIVIDGDILERVELETGKLLISVSVASLLGVAMPQMDKIAFHEADIRTHRVVERLGPGQIMNSLRAVHGLNTDRVVEVSVGGTQHSAVPSANYASVVKAVLSQEIPASRPRKAMEASDLTSRRAHARCRSHA